MNGPEVVQEIDASLLPFLGTTDEIESRRLCEQLVYHTADEIIKSVIGRELQVSLNKADYGYYDTELIQDAKDLYGDIVERLLRRLNYLKTNSDSETISNFSSYVAVMAKNACCDYLRRKYRNHWKLRMQVRYLLTHNGDFAIWENERKQLLCGLAAWWGADSVMDREQALKRLVLSGKEINSPNLAILVNSIFKQLGKPVNLDVLISIIAELGDIKDSPGEELDEHIYKLRSPQPSVERQVEQHIFLKRLWAEICKLSVRQRIALLLNLRDQGGYGIALFPYRGIATIRQIADALEMPQEEFAGIWNELPLDDETIAGYLGIMRQQVINLRKAARERLARNMRDFC
jgi:RNA polymerase sigma factor (sigma-70 family)